MSAESADGGIKEWWNKAKSWFGSSPQAVPNSDDSTLLDEVVVSANRKPSIWKRMGFSKDKLSRDWEDNKEKSGYNHAANYVEDNRENISNAWNSPLARGMVSDSYSIGLSSNVTAFLGVGSTPINFTLLTRGKEPGLYFTPTINAALGDGIEANAGISFGRGIYTGNPRNINSGMLQGHTYGASGGLGIILDASAGASYAPTGNGNGFINVSGQVGLGIEGSPASVINLQGNYQYTPIVLPIIKF